MTSYSKKNIEKDIKAASQVQQLSKELFRSTEISWFGYYRFQKNRDISFIATDPEIHEFYMKGQHYLDEFPQLNFDSLCSNVTLPSLNAKTDKERKLYDALHEKYQLSDFINVSNKTDEACEVFCFAGSGKEINNFYLNNLGFLKNFGNISHDSLNRIMKANNVCTVNLPESKPYTTPHPARNDHINIYLDIIIDAISAGKKLSGAEDVRLSPRESECLHMIVKGKTAKEAAQLLKLSHRTVESYFDSLKDKLDCSRRQDLYNLFSGIIKH